jgi:hypothetical protein
MIILAQKYVSTQLDKLPPLRLYFSHSFRERRDGGEPGLKYGIA